MKLLANVDLGPIKAGEIVAPKFNPGPGGANAGTAFANLASTIVGFLTVLAGLYCALMLILGGIQYIASQGDKTNLTKARDQITWAIAGLAIVVLSWSIIWLIGKVLGIDILNIENLLNNIKK